MSDFVRVSMGSPHAKTTEVVVSRRSPRDEVFLMPNGNLYRHDPEPVRDIVATPRLPPVPFVPVKHGGTAFRTPMVRWLVHQDPLDLLRFLFGVEPHYDDDPARPHIGRRLVAGLVAVTGTVAALDTGAQAAVKSDVTPAISQSVPFRWVTIFTAIDGQSYYALGNEGDARIARGAGFEVIGGRVIPGANPEANYVPMPTGVSTVQVAPPQIGPPAPEPTTTEVPTTVPAPPPTTVAVVPTTVVPPPTTLAPAPPTTIAPVIAPAPTPPPPKPPTKAARAAAEARAARAKANAVARASRRQQALTKRLAAEHAAVARAAAARHAAAVRKAAAIAAQHAAAVERQKELAARVAAARQQERAAAAAAKAAKVRRAATAAAKKAPNISTQIYDLLIGAGLTPIAATGILGNFQSESSLQPERLENTPNGDATPYQSMSPFTLNDPSVGWGLPQATPAAKMVDWIKAQSGDPNSALWQVKWVCAELAGSPLLAQINAAPTAGAAAELFESGFERPHTLGDRGTRAKQAQGFYDSITATTEANSRSRRKKQRG
jgi:hypothetical protein